MSKVICAKCGKELFPQHYFEDRVVARASLIDHLSRSPLFKAVSITTKKIPFRLIPDVRADLEGQQKWIERNLQYHQEALDSINADVKHSREFGIFPVPEDLLKRRPAGRPVRVRLKSC